MSDQPWGKLPTGQTSATVVYRNAAGQAWNGSAFVAWNDGNLATYKKPCAEQGTTGRYYPASNPPAGWADATFYDDTGLDWGAYPNSDLDLDAIADAVLARGASNVESAADRHSVAAVIMLATNSSSSGNTVTAKKPSNDATFATYTTTTDPDAEPTTGIS